MLAVFAQVEGFIGYDEKNLKSIGFANSTLGANLPLRENTFAEGYRDVFKFERTQLFIERARALAEPLATRKSISGTASPGPRNVSWVCRVLAPNRPRGLWAEHGSSARSLQTSIVSAM
jgi:hypothetical protein